MKTGKFLRFPIKRRPRPPFGPKPPTGGGLPLPRPYVVTMAVGRAAA